MNKKLMAVAVAGAFVTPALVFAQNATVQVYGKATVEYGYADMGDNKPNSDIFQTPGGSAVGFKGQEQLGGGLSAWFQCETSADVRGLNQDGFCSRNSAIGLKGNWGNVFFGKWDTPFKKASQIGTPGSTETGLLGAAFLTFGNSTGAGTLGGQGASPTLIRNVWRRRETGIISYESPDFSGFKLMGAFTAANSTGVTDSTTNAKPRTGSIAGTYNNGPLNIGAGYEKHYNFGNGSTGVTTPAVAASNGLAQFLATPTTANAGSVPVSFFTAPTAASAGASTTGSGNDDRAWTVGINYTFMGNLLVGLQYSEMKYELAAGADLKKTTWHIGGDWNFSGPHHVTAAWTHADDTKGSATVAQTAASGLTSGNGAIVAPGSNTGGEFWTLQYGFDFSKRTRFQFGYSHLDNDQFSRYSLGGLSTTSAATAGQSQSAWAMYGSHVW